MKLGGKRSLKQITNQPKITQAFKPVVATNRSTIIVILTSIIRPNLINILIINKANPKKMITITPLLEADKNRLKLIKT